MIQHKQSINRSINQKSTFKPALQLSLEKDIDSNWLKLKNPKIIYVVTEQSHLGLNKITNLADVPVDEISGPMASRGDKKNKSHNKLIDPLESKKNKIKPKKKLRSKIHINDEDDNLETQSSSFLKSDRSLALSLMRPVNPLKKNTPSKRFVNITHTQRKVSKDKHDKSKPEKVLLEVRPTKVLIPGPISIEELSRILIIPAPEIIKSLFLKGISVTINQIVDAKLAQSVAGDYGILIEENNSEDLLKHDLSYVHKNNSAKTGSLYKRSPIVTLLGHVDHGKTTLLDTIRQTHQNTIEAGGITQTIMAYEVSVKHDECNNKIIFLDTPGHEAFTSMRVRGMQVTDLAVLVVAADDGLQSQSIETIDYLKRYKVPFIVAINKIDKKSANIASLKEKLESVGVTEKPSSGKVPIVEVSALQKQNINQLLLTILSLADQQSLLANPESQGLGTILDAYLDKSQGPIANILVQDGTVKVGDFISNKTFAAKVRSIVGQDSQKYAEVGPSSVVKISGLSEIPKSGSLFKVINHDKNLRKQLSEQHKGKDNILKSYQKMNTRVTFDSSKKTKDSTVQKNVNIILKTDSEGTIEALINAFEGIPQEKVQLNIVSLGVGEITLSDISLASVSESILIGFNSNITPRTQLLADKANTTLADFKIIYNLIEFIKKVMLELVEVDYEEIIIGQAIVETVFAVSKGNVAGCMVSSGKLKRGSHFRVKRKNECIYNGELNSLKRVKEDVEEITSGNECGVLCHKFDIWQKKDEIEAYDLVEMEKTL
uniref:translation initiation factor 2 n=1 Tax=Rhodochorton tenue TaxID=173034 RepID=UPI002A80E0B9|nr:translation initiation factor 2 [Rhodochorton tenue]WOK79502.1 translation initiation factor 2 [Rhodochorton tenue]